jgi:hypothetical protein
VIVHIAYTPFKKAVTNGGRNAYYNSEGFIDRHAVYVINTSRREIVTEEDKLVLVVTEYFHTVVPNKKMCIVILIGEKNFPYNVLEEKLSEQN